MADPAAVTTTRAAALLGVTDETIRRMIRRGELVAWRVGTRDLRIAVAEIESYQCRNRIAVPEVVSTPEVPTSSTAAAGGTRTSPPRPRERRSARKTRPSPRDSSESCSTAADLAAWISQRKSSPSP